MRKVLQNKDVEIIATDVNGVKVAEISSDEILIGDIRSGTDFLVDVYYQGFDKIILDEKNIAPKFFDLKSGFAGEILQAVSNFRLQLAIKGDYSKFSSKSLKSFMGESNQHGQISFIDSGI